jgi:NAD(P)-dependent dehydrogenase (short-subunit alcohol dehydrogenase family)
MHIISKVVLVTGASSGFGQATAALLALIILALGALRKGVNSSDRVDSPEWKQRQQWYGFH